MTKKVALSMIIAPEISAIVLLSWSTEQNGHVLL